jgi:FtsP/CotA-like multicopper oxidase with cupredoxin domain
MTEFDVDYSVQYGGGILGPIIIAGPTTTNWDIDVGALPLTDWFHEGIFTAEDQEQHALGPLTADNALVNGSMVAASGSGGSYSVTTLTPGKAHLLRLVNTGINQYFTVSIDNHPMTVVAADWTPIVPFNTSSITLAIGIRCSLSLQACPNSFTHRSTLRCYYPCEPDSWKLLGSRCDRRRWSL